MTHNVETILHHSLHIVALCKERCQQVRSFKIAADVEHERGEMTTRRTEGHFDKTYS